MNLFPFFNEDGFSNSYILAEKEHNGPCLIIDPSDFTVEMLHLVESHDYTVEGIFLTHYNRMHTTGLTKLTKIYNPQIYSPRIGEKDHFEITEIGDRKTIAAAGMTVNVLNFLGDFGKAVFYRVNGCLFTGDLYLAGDRHEEEELLSSKISKNGYRRTNKIIKFIPVTGLRLPAGWSFRKYLHETVLFFTSADHNSHGLQRPLD